MAGRNTIKDMFLKKVTPIVQSDCKSYYNEFAKAYGRSAQRNYTDAAREAIEQFYADYAPKYYERTNDLRFNSYQPYYENKGSHIYGGVRLTPEAMQDYVSSYDVDGSGRVIGVGVTPKEEVFYRTWYEGLHGYTMTGEPIVTTPPINILKERLSDVSLQDLLYSDGKAAAQSKKYSLLHHFFC